RWHGAADRGPWARQRRRACLVARWHTAGLRQRSRKPAGLSWALYHQPGREWADEAHRRQLGRFPPQLVAGWDEDRFQPAAITMRGRPLVTGRLAFSSKEDARWREQNAPGSPSW